jgi:hypothetical protein
MTPRLYAPRSHEKAARRGSHRVAWTPRHLGAADPAQGTGRVPESGRHTPRAQTPPRSSAFREKLDLMFAIDIGSRRGTRRRVREKRRIVR